MDNLERNLDLILVTYKGKLADNFSVISAQNKMTSSLFYLLGKKCYLLDLSIYKFLMLCYVMLYITLQISIFVDLFLGQSVNLFTFLSTSLLPFLPINLFPTFILHVLIYFLFFFH